MASLSLWGHVLVGCLLLSWWWGGAHLCYAGEGTLAEPISFGAIICNPGGDTIRIDASQGPAGPVAERSIVAGGKSGRVRIVSSTIEHVDVLYPERVTLRNGSQIIVFEDIAANSQYSSGGVDTLGDEIPLDISIGGKLVLSGSVVRGSYNGTLSLVLNFDVPAEESGVVNAIEALEVEPLVEPVLEKDNALPAE